VEVSLTQASTQLDAQLADAAMIQYFSDERALLESISKTLIQQRQEVVEIPLRDPANPYWWSTRLFLIAALTQDYARVRCFVFVDGGRDRRFVGVATPGDLRLSLAREFPTLAEVYANQVTNLTPTQLPTQQVEQLIQGWSAAMFTRNAERLGEKDFMTKVDRFNLSDWMSKIGGLDDRSVRWRGFQDRALLADIVSFDGPYVPLVAHGRLHMIVSRWAVIEEVAAKAVA
jgi:hypothetical protein